jgi:hypothetical protein
MKGTDKYLIGIVIGIVLLIVITVIVVLTRPEAEYRSDDSPEAIVHNYLLAIKETDYDRAYGYISPDIDEYPEDLEAFIEIVENEPWIFGQRSDSVLEIQSFRGSGDKTTVKVLETIYDSGGIFGSGHYDRYFDMKLHWENDEWRLVDGDQYWYRCWDEDRPSWCE